MEKYIKKKIKEYFKEKMLVLYEEENYYSRVKIDYRPIGYLEITIDKKFWEVDSIECKGYFVKYLDRVVLLKDDLNEYLKKKGGRENE